MAKLQTDEARCRPESSSRPRLSGSVEVSARRAHHLRALDPETRILVRAELRYEGDEGLVRRRGRGERPPALAAILSDGTVIPGDARTS
jgi:hypothetical protein